MIADPSTGIWTCRCCVVRLVSLFGYLGLIYRWVYACRKLYPHPHPTPTCPFPHTQTMMAFSLHARIWGECLIIHSPPALWCVYVCFLFVCLFLVFFGCCFFVCLFFVCLFCFVLFFEVGISSRTIPLSMPDRSVHSGSASWDDWDKYPF